MVETIMATAPRYQHVQFGITDDQVKQRNGFTYARTPTPLEEYPKRLTDKLLHWASTVPQRTYIAQRDSTGQWRHISYSQALEHARSIGQALLDRKLDEQRPVIIISGNDIEHALLALGCQMAGVPYASISPAYSLVSRDYQKLRHVVDTLTPGLVFASDAQPYLAAVEATVPADT